MKIIVVWFVLVFAVKARENFEGLSALPEAVDYSHDCRDIPKTLKNIWQNQLSIIRRQKTLEEWLGEEESEKRTRVLGRIVKSNQFQYGEVFKRFLYDYYGKHCSSSPSLPELRPCDNLADAYSTVSEAGKDILPILEAIKEDTDLKNISKICNRISTKGKYFTFSGYEQACIIGRDEYNRVHPPDPVAKLGKSRTLPVYNRRGRIERVKDRIPPLEAGVLGGLQSILGEGGTNLLGRWITHKSFVYWLDDTTVEGINRLQTIHDYQQLEDYTEDRFSEDLYRYLNPTPPDFEL